jgi:3-oxoisoapionate decarboxylase
MSHTLTQAPVSGFRYKLSIMHRRAFLQSIPAAAAFAATAQNLPNNALPRNTVPIKLGFDTYSLRAFKWKAPQLIDYAGNLKLDTIQISSLDEFESKEPAYLQKIKDQAARLNMTLDGGMGSICPSSHSFSKNGPPARDRLLEGLRVARAIGAKAMRCFMGSSADRSGPLPIEAHMENTINVFKSVSGEALDMGVRIAIENHDGDMQAREVKTIIEESGKDYVGSNLDTGNPLWVVEDPFVTLETLAPYVVTTHIRDSVVFEIPRGAAGQWVVLGDGTVDFVRFMERFRELCPKSSMQMELITGRPPRIIPYLEPDFWKAFPKASAAEFARFVALAKAGHPYMGAMVVEDVAGTKPAIMTDALKEQQRIDLERSLEYAKKKLNAGVNWRG